MSNPNEATLNGMHDSASARIAELETENARLRGELAESRRVQQVDRAFLVARTMDDFPKSEEEFLRLVQEGPTLKEVLMELVPEADKDGRP
jgi:hypothetical protein